MCQTGVPFGQTTLVKEWMGICGSVIVPNGTNKNRPILGYECEKQEVSGSRYVIIGRMIIRF